MFHFLLILFFIEKLEKMLAVKQYAEGDIYPLKDTPDSQQKPLNENKSPLQGKKQASTVKHV